MNDDGTQGVSHLSVVFAALPPTRTSTSVTQLPSLLAHMAWADQRTLSTLRDMTSPPEQAVKLFAHIVAAQHIWLTRIDGTTARCMVWPLLSLDESEALAHENQATFPALGSAEDQALARIVRYTNSAGNTFDDAVADILLHVTHHSMYHRGQIAMLAREAGGNPTSTDYITFRRQNRD